jgi:hypothetical protein
MTHVARRLRGRARRGLLKGRLLDPSAEQVLFALVANRALAPSSKLAAFPGRTTTSISMSAADPRRQTVHHLLRPRGRDARCQGA